MARSTSKTPPTGVFAIPVTETGKSVGDLTRFELNPKGMSLNDLVDKATQASLVGPGGWVKIYVGKTNPRGRAVMYDDAKFLGMCRLREPVELTK